MTVFEKIKSMNIDEFAEWLDAYGTWDGGCPWIKWFDSTYCQNCEPVLVKAEDCYYNKDMEFAWCELNDEKCKFFPDLDEVPDGKQIVKLWLESNC